LSISCLFSAGVAVRRGRRSAGQLNYPRSDDASRGAASTSTWSSLGVIGPRRTEASKVGRMVGCEVCRQGGSRSASRFLAISWRESIELPAQRLDRGAGFSRAGSRPRRGRTRRKSWNEPPSRTTRP